MIILSKNSNLTQELTVINRYIIAYLLLSQNTCKPILNRNGVIMNDEDV